MLARDLACIRFDYVSRYCEENVWRLLGRPEMDGFDTYAVVVTGPGGFVGMFSQREGRSGDGFVLWDYHVIAMVREPTGDAQGPWTALDFDTRRGFTSVLDDWLDSSFPESASAALLAGRADPLFRPVSGSEYARMLFSDRSHMRAGDGTWIKPPPDWPCPGSGGGSPSAGGAGLRLLDLMDPAWEPEALLTLDGMRKAFGGPYQS